MKETLRHMGEKIIWSNPQLTGVPDEKIKMSGTETIFAIFKKKKKDENFLEWMKDMSLQISQMPRQDK